MQAAKQPTVHCRTSRRSLLDGPQPVARRAVGRVSSVGVDLRAAVPVNAHAGHSIISDGSTYGCAVTRPRPTEHRSNCRACRCTRSLCHPGCRIEGRWLNRLPIRPRGRCQASRLVTAGVMARRVLARRRVIASDDPDGTVSTGLRYLPEAASQEPNASCHAELSVVGCPGRGAERWLIG